MLSLHDFWLGKDKYLNAMQFLRYLLEETVIIFDWTEQDIILWLRVKACAIVGITAGLLVNYTGICTAVATFLSVLPVNSLLQFNQFSDFDGLFGPDSSSPSSNCVTIAWVPCGASRIVGLAG